MGSASPVSLGMSERWSAWSEQVVLVLMLVLVMVMMLILILMLLMTPAW